MTTSNAGTAWLNVLDEQLGRMKKSLSEEDFDLAIKLFVRQNEALIREIDPEHELLELLED